MGYCTAHVRFRKQSGHGLSRKSAFAVAIGGKADMPCCTACPLVTPKRTCADTIRELRQCSRKAIPTGVDFAVGSSRNRITLHLMVRSSYKLNTVIREVPISSGRKR